MLSCTRITLVLAISLLVIAYLAENEVSASPIAMPMPGGDDDGCKTEPPKKKKNKKKEPKDSQEDCDDEEDPKPKKHKKKQPEDDCEDEVPKKPKKHGKKHKGGKMQKVEKDFEGLACDFEDLSSGP